MITYKTSPLPQALRDRLAHLFTSDDMLLLRRVAAIEMSAYQVDAMRFSFKPDSQPGMVSTKAVPELIRAQRFQIFLEVLDELSRPDYTYREIELKHT